MSDPLKPYIDDILADTDRILFEEAAACARSGANRSAYVMVWLSCAESLKRRFNAVKSRDATAKKVAGEIARMESEHRSIDMYLLTKAKEYGFIDDAGFTRLSHIYEMRCVYGHPYERRPKDEDLFAAGAAATELVLSQPLRLRHGYLSEQVRLLTEERTFLDDHRESVADYAREVAGRMDEDLTEWFVEKLWMAAEALAGDKSMSLFVRRAAWFCSDLLASSPSKIIAQWDLPSALTATPVVGSSSLSDKRVFTEITRHVQDIVVGNLVENAKTDSRSLRPLQGLADAASMNERQLARFQKAVDTLPLKTMADVGIKLDYYASRIIIELKSHNWYTQNPAIAVLKNAGRDSIGSLDESIQEELGNNILQSADGGAGSSREFLSEIAEDDSPWPSSFVKGLVTECFVNDDNRIRFKVDQAKEAMLALTTVEIKERREIVRGITDRLASGNPKDGYRLDRRRKEMLQAIDKVLKQEPKKLKVLSELQKAVSSVELSKEDEDD